MTALTLSAAPISLVVNGRPVTVTASPRRRLLDVLRRDLGLTGAKEVCGEGECGACAVLLDGQLVNSCLVPVGQADGGSVVTVEGLAADGRLAPLQQAFLQLGGTQCGMCAGGMLLAAQAMLDAGVAPDVDSVRAAISGTLCRCTGYTKIIESVVSLAGSRAPVGPESMPHGTTRPERETRHPTWGEVDLVRPHSLPEALERLAERPELMPIGGGTDLLVDEDPAPGQRPLLDLTLLDELRGIEMRGDDLVLGALTTFTDLRRSPLIAEFLPVLAEVADSMGGPAIRNRATIGGNCVTASPAGDLLPVLIATDARLNVASRHETRPVSADAFWTGYRMTALRPGELLQSIAVSVSPAREVRYRKVGTRRALSVAKALVVLSWCPSQDGAWHNVRVGLGSVAERPLRARLTEALLEGHVPDATLAQAASVLVQQEIRPIDDIRSTAVYRRLVTGRVLRRMIAEPD